MPNSKLIDSLQRDFPEFKFVSGQKFAFRPPKTIVLGPEEPRSELLALHEVGHAVLEHRDFKTDVERLKMECMAWEKARELADVYGVLFDKEFTEGELDTYRDWLHKKSRCPNCGLTRFQDTDGYHCPRCEEFISSLGHDERFVRP